MVGPDQGEAAGLQEHRGTWTGKCGDSREVGEDAARGEVSDGLAPTLDSGLRVRTQSRSQQCERWLLRACPWQWATGNAQRCQDVLGTVLKKGSEGSERILERIFCVGPANYC